MPLGKTHSHVVLLYGLCINTPAERELALAKNEDTVTHLSHPDFFNANRTIDMLVHRLVGVHVDRGRTGGT